MAISFLKKPQLIAPAYNDNIFQFVSNNANIRAFNVEVIDADTSEIKFKLKPTIKPNYLTGTYFNLSSTLSALVESKIFKNSNIVVGYDEGVFKYRIKVTEVLAGGSLGSTYDNTNEVFTVFNGELSRLNFNYFNYRDYLLETIDTLRFATNKPNNSAVNVWTTEYLSFLSNVDGSSPAFCVQFKTYTASGTLLDTYTTDSIEPIFSVYRINVSPKDLVSGLGINFDGVAFYTVQIINESNLLLSELRTYWCYQIPCNVEPVNVVWINEYGVPESFTFINPKETIKINKQSFKTHYNRLNSDGLFGNEDSEILNADDKIYSLTSTSTYSLTTTPLDDIHYSFLTGLLKSKEVYVELSDYSLLPIKLNTTSIEVKRRKYSTELLRFPISFDSVSGLNVTTEELEVFGNRIGILGFEYNTSFTPGSGNKFYTTLIGNGSATTFIVSHNFGSKAIDVELVEEATGEVTYANIVIVNNNQIQIDFSDAPGTGAIRVNILQMN